MKMSQPSHPQLTHELRTIPMLKVLPELERKYLSYSGVCSAFPQEVGMKRARRQTNNW